MSMGDDSNSRGFAFGDHPYRRFISREMHGRKLPPIAPPARIMQVVLQIDEGELARERQQLRGLFSGTMEIDESSRYIRGRIGPIHCIWERHTEISSYMFIRPGPFDSPFDPEDFDIVPRDWFVSLPGVVVRATQVAIVADASAVNLAGAFRAEDMVHCDLMDGLARLQSDFRLNDDGFGRLLVEDLGMTAGEVALAVQRVQELGNYRNLALLGLPVAQEFAAHVSRLEETLCETTRLIADRAIPDNLLLSSLSDLSADIARIATQTHYRMSASRAYSEMVEDRLRGLRVGRIAGFQALNDFTERRLLPAVRTCISFNARVENLAQRVAWTSDLLRTRVDTELATQNRDLLRSMNRRTAAQLRLQQAVEGLSVVAISYYSLGLIDHVIAGAQLGAAIDRPFVLAVLVPIIFVASWFGIWRIRRRFERVSEIDGG